MVYKDKEKSLAAVRKWRRNNPKAAMIANARRRAKVSGLAFEITKDDFEIPMHCPVLGIPIYRKEGKQSDNSPALDRVDNSKGYVKGNVCVVSQKLNRIKSDMTLDQARKLVEYMEYYTDN